MALESSKKKDSIESLQSLIMSRAEKGHFCCEYDLEKWQMQDFDCLTAIPEARNMESRYIDIVRRVLPDDYKMRIENNGWRLFIWW
jgi:hypothetical protein